MSSENYVGIIMAENLRMKVIHEDGEDLLSTLDSDEELEAVYEQFMELLFDEDEE